MKKSFYEIGLNLTDKIYHHRYDRFYPTFLESLRKSSFNLLEIGIDTGGSLLLWKEYFPKAKIYGIDINLELKNDDFTIYKIDQSDLDQIKKATKLIPKCQLIIDDGSHHPIHQLETFLEFFDKILEYGGIYIIEDIECNYWRPETSIYGYEIGHFNIIDYFKNTPDQINCEFNKKKNTLNISSITFAHNCIIVVKKTIDEINFSNRKYRFDHML
jgi:hypothetical protein